MMCRHCRSLSVVLLCAGSAGVAAAQPSSTRPPENIDRGLRPLSPSEIPPNLSFYTLDPFYEPGRPLGWAKERIEERLDRGMLALAREGGGVYLGWRLLRDDPAGVAFNVYRARAGATVGARLNAEPLTATTDWVDEAAPLDGAQEWWVVPVVGGRELRVSERASLPAKPLPLGYRALRLKEDVTSVAAVAIGDLDGDGAYDFVVKHPAAGKDPGRVRVNEGTYKIDAYDGRSGAFLWRIDLGWNVDMGIWWTPLVVRDLDGDGKAEVCLRTAPYAATLEDAFPSAKEGNVLEGPEWLAVYDGASGALVDKVDWIERGKPEDWGDHSGNRASRHMLGVAYLDGKTPAVLVVRGIYGLMRVDAWMLKDRKLEKLWRWSNERAPFKFQGQGQHSIKVGDIDGDGCDEILNGTIAIDNDGRTMWGTGNGHGDRFYLADVDPSHPGLEVFFIHEDPQPRDGLNLVDARTGRVLWGLDEASKDDQLGGALVGDIDPTHPGMECWASTGEGLFFTSRGERIAGEAPPTSFLAYWDADLLREVIDPGRRTGGGMRIGKWQGATLTSGIEGGLLQIADILGDWREELITYSGGELRIYSTTIPASDRRPCLMQDPIYRHDVTHRSMGYPHTPQLSTYLGTRP
jgi:rhamnogalacturonan endolyase